MQEKLGFIVHSLEVSGGVVETAFVCELVGKIASMVGHFMEKVVTDTIEKLDVHEKYAEELIDAMQETRKENALMEATIARFREQN